MSSLHETGDFSIEAVRRQIEDRLPFGSHEKDGDFLLNEFARERIMENAQKQAAVLIGLVEREGETNVILTKRTEKLNSHSGQISFPGGKVDAEDPSPEAAALREAWEEIGLQQSEVSVIGRMPTYHSGSRFLIAPVIGEVKHEADFEINPDEVEYRFEVPLRFLMNPDNHTIASRTFDKNVWHYFEMPFEQHYIWGMTAGMLRMFYERIFAREPFDGIR